MRFFGSLLSAAFVFSPIPWLAALLRLPSLLYDLALYHGRAFPHLKNKSLLLHGPFVLLTGGGSSAQWHTETRTAKPGVLRRLYPQPKGCRRCGR